MDSTAYVDLHKAAAGGHRDLAVIEPTKLAEMAVPTHLLWGVYLVGFCGLYLMDKFTSRSDCGRGRVEVHPESLSRSL